ARRSRLGCADDRGGRQRHTPGMPGVRSRPRSRRSVLPGLRARLLASRGRRHGGVGGRAGRASQEEPLRAEDAADPRTFPSGDVASTTTPTPGPSTQAPDEVIAAFFKAVRDPAAAFEVKVNGTFTQTTRGKRATGSIVADVRVVGDSLAGTLRLTQPGAPAFSGSIVRIGPHSWTRDPGTARRQQPPPAAAHP